jgi:hypothetical protein
MTPALLSAFLLFSQAPPPSIVGTIRDAESGAGLAGAVVTVTDLARSVVTDGDGRYRIEPISSGEHDISIRLIGYGVRTLTAIVPPDGQLAINVSLQPAPVLLPNIEVRGTPQGPPRSDGTVPDQVALMASAWANPLLSEPDAFEAVEAAVASRQPEAPSGLSLRGGAPDQTAYLLDGIPVFSPYHAAGVFSAWNPDALSELSVQAAASGVEYAEGLSGSVNGVTREPDQSLTVRGGMSTTQARLTLDGPLGRGGAGFLLSTRDGLPGGLNPAGEASYLRGSTSDWLAKIELPAFGGRLRMLGYDSENGFNAAVAAQGEVVSSAVPRNQFSWYSRSVGVEWNGVLGNTALRLRAWSANATAASEWLAVFSPINLTSARHDQGILAMIQRASATGMTSLGLRLTRSNTAYRIEPDTTAPTALAMNAFTPVATVFVQRWQSLGPTMDLDLGASLATEGRDAYLGPSAQIHWRPASKLSLTGSYARRHQFAQSLRNPESVVGSVFPVDLYVGAGAPGVPVARNDQAVLALEYRPAARVRLGLQAYDRNQRGLVLVGPGESEPFATQEFDVGSGKARGVSLSAGVTTGPLALTGSYGVQAITLRHGDSSYVPEYGPAQVLEGGATIAPGRSTAIRLGVMSMFGRRATPVASGLEWESCNLLDRGCEFGGSPHYTGAGLGSRSLPAYLRVDLGVRQHLRFMLRGQAADVAAYATVTNLFNRHNVLTYANNAMTGQAAAVDMRPLAPLVVGLDWRF